MTDWKGIELLPNSELPKLETLAEVETEVAKVKAGIAEGKWEAERGRLMLEALEDIRISILWSEKWQVT